MGFNSGFKGLNVEL